ncbi:hypothetical protein [Mesorhizobium delmotii]|uniref:Uncharacterized protein n=1 Tax=Mesorhizobium delmotii TaxID=1631247 RepID=A0A2P9AMY2_9HYPH|nr:hypothetical protein [Mesorhizobium delmotii]SJM32488.1 hypothetical protein BQ8482_290083 [Mesorhizobium delmotii]
MADLRGGAFRDVFAFTARHRCKQPARLRFIMTMFLASTPAGWLGATDAIARDKVKPGEQTQIGRVQPGGEPAALQIPACRETTKKFGSSDPNDPVDGTVNKTITEWLAAGNKADWKSNFGIDSPALGDA